MAPLSSWGRIALGAVTGSNDFFTVSNDDVRRFEISRRDLVRISPPGSSHLRAISFTSSDYQRLRRAGKKVYLLRPGDEPSGGTKRYIERGRRAGVHKAYKCQIRTPWWRPPLVAKPDLFLTYMNADTPRLAANAAGVHHLNSVHGLFLKPELTDLSLALAVASVNSATLLGAELVGRSYGGGILKLEPGEAVNLPLPTPEQVRDHLSALLGLAETMREKTLRLPIELAAEAVDELLFASVVGPETLRTIQVARYAFAQRRKVRGSSHRKVD